MSSNVNTPKNPTITPEKARLMKALELRKKQKLKSEAPQQPAPMETPSSPASDGLKSPAIEDNRLSGAPQEVHDTLAMLNDMSKEDDSGIAFDAISTLKTDESDATRIDSYPVSPVGPSERAESTRASSISESTDETIQEGQVPKLAFGEEEKAINDAHQKAPTLTPRHEYKGHDTPAEHPILEDFPHLLPTTYESLPSPINVPHIYRAATPATGAEVAREFSQRLNPAEAVSNDSHDLDISRASRPEAKTKAASILESKDNSANSPSNALIPENVPQPPSSVKIPIKELKVPRSKFSVQDLHAEAETPPIPQQIHPLSVNHGSLSASPPSPIRSSFSIDSRRLVTEDEQEFGATASGRLRRRAMVDPIKTDIEHTDKSAATSDANFSSDDDLMDELQSAVIQDAQPMSVSKSPISPVFPSPKKKEQNRFSRAFSSPIRNASVGSQHLTPPSRTDPSRSVSASAYLNRINSQTSKPMATKVNVGSGISQRIKALEKLSSLAPGASEIPGTAAPSSSPAFFSVRKSVRVSKSPSIAGRANSLNRNTPSPEVTRDSPPDAFKLRQRSSSIKSRVDAFSAAPGPTNQHRSRPESISVTARIIRDPNQPFPAKSELGRDPSEFTPLDLKQSPLIIDHQKAVSIPTNETIQERRLSTSSKISKATTTRERRSSITVVKDLINQSRASLSERRRSVTLEISTLTSLAISPNRPPSTRATSPGPGAHKAMSISSRRSTSSRDLGGSFSPPPTARSSNSFSDEKDKKSNRASRMLRRMSSSFSSSSKKNTLRAMSPTVREESEPFASPFRDSSNPSLSSNVPANVNIGDVNVQFPDTLLWKRRSMLLDSQGYLIVSPALTGHGNDRDKANAGAIRRYHLSSFRTPAIPDVEMQELPNSVVLNFVEGGGLQVACEDRGGQGQVLNSKFKSSCPVIEKLLTQLPVLQNAHRIWAAYGQ